MHTRDLPMHTCDHAIYNVASSYTPDASMAGAMREAISDAMAAAVIASLKPPKFGTHQGVDLDKLLTKHVHDIAAVYVARTGFAQHKNGIVPRARVAEIKTTTADHVTLRVTVGLFSLFNDCEVKSRVATFSITLPTAGVRAGDKDKYTSVSDWAI